MFCPNERRRLNGAVNCKPLANPLLVASMTADTQAEEGDAEERK
jgi:hypothetical protein